MCSRAAAARKRNIPAPSDLSFTSCRLPKLSGWPLEETETRSTACPQTRTTKARRLLCHRTEGGGGIKSTSRRDGGGCPNDFWDESLVLAVVVESVERLPLAACVEGSTALQNRMADCFRLLTHTPPKEIQAVKQQTYISGYLCCLSEKSRA